MRILSDELTGALAGTVTKLAICWRITRADGKIMGFTSHNNKISLGGLDYLVECSLSHDIIKDYSSFRPGSFGIVGLADDPNIAITDVRNGVYEGAMVEISLVDYELLQAIPIKSGYISGLSIMDNVFVMEISGISEKLNNDAKTCYSHKCRAVLGDQKCKMNLQPFTFQAKVTSIIDARTFCAESLTQENGYFTYGTVAFASGTVIDIAQHTKGGFIELYSPKAIVLNDEFIIVAGCNKLFNECGKKFNNQVNFRGEPHVKNIVDVYG